MSTENPTAVDVTQINRVIAVMTTVRAGTSLMSSLLDAHPNVLTTPDCVLMHFTTFWNEFGHLPAEELIDKFMDYYAVLFDAGDTSLSPDLATDTGSDLNFTELGPNRDQSVSVDRKKFKDIFMAVLPKDRELSRKLFFQTAHYSYTAGWGHTVSDPVISFGLHIAHDVTMADFLEDFPDALFLQMVRNPVLALASHFRMYLRHGQLGPKSAVAAMAMARYMGSPKPEENREHWRAIRLEDLHIEPRDTLGRLCEWLELPWDESLMESTLNGKQWWNEKNSIQVSGMDAAIPNQRFNEYLPMFDRFRLEVLFAPKCVAWNYPVKPIHQNLVIRLLVLPCLAVPLKMELISIFSKESSYENLGFFSRISERWKAYYYGRRFLVGAWIRTFKDRRTEVQLV